MNRLAVRAHALRTALRAFGRQPLLAALALALATAALALPLLLATLAAPLRDVWARIDAPAQAIVFAAGATSAAELSALHAKLAEQPAVLDTTQVPRAAALAELARRTPAGLPDMKTNPLPDAIIVRFARGAPAALIESSIAAIRKLPRVDAVQFDSDWYRRWTAALGAAGAAGMAALAALVVLSVAGVAVAARLCTVTSAAELRLLALVGTTASDRRRPRAYAGALLGLAAGALACSAVAGTLGLVAPRLAAWPVADGFSLSWSMLPWPLLAGLVAGAGALGYVAGVLAGRRGDRASEP